MEIVLKKGGGGYKNTNFKGNKDQDHYKELQNWSSEDSKFRGQKVDVFIKTVVFKKIL